MRFGVTLAVDHFGNLRRLPSSGAVESDRPLVEGLVMRQTWTDIAERLGWLQHEVKDAAFQAALGGMQELATQIAEGPLSSALYGWTSMHDLCIQQSDVAPYSGPYLRISPLASGMVEFCYVDTQTANRQWRREVPPEATTARFVRFLRQLHWIGGGVLIGF